MLGQRLRRWPKIEPTLGERPPLAVHIVASVPKGTHVTWWRHVARDG